MKSANLEFGQLPGTLGEKVQPAGKPAEPEWKPYPQNPAMEINKAGHLRTKNHPKPEELRKDQLPKPYKWDDPQATPDVGKAKLEEHAFRGLHLFLAGNLIFKTDSESRLQIYTGEPGRDKWAAPSDLAVKALEISKGKRIPAKSAMYRGREYAAYPGVTFQHWHNAKFVMDNPENRALLVK